METQKNYSQYAHARASGDDDQVLRSILIELKRSKRREFLLNQNQIRVPHLEIKVVANCHEVANCHWKTNAHGRSVPLSKRERG